MSIIVVTEQTPESMPTYICQKLRLGLRCRLAHSERLWKLNRGGFQAVHK
jgi:hypothetical protein